MASASSSGGGWRQWARRPPTPVVAAVSALAGVAVGAALPLGRGSDSSSRNNSSSSCSSSSSGAPDLPLRPEPVVVAPPELAVVASSTTTTTAAAVSTAAMTANHRPAAAAAAAGGPVTREALGRATWTLLHTLAARFPDRPTRRQRRDAEALIDSLTRVYPCGECAAHFAALCRDDPPDASSGAALRQWTCRAHNAVNARLGKPTFDCALAAARWAPEACDSGVGGGKEGDACAMGVGAAAAAAGAAAVADATARRTRW